MSNLNLLESIFLYRHNTCNGIPVIRNNTPYREMGCPVCNEPFGVFQLIVLAHASRFRVTVSYQPCLKPRWPARYQHKTEQGQSHLQHLAAKWPHIT